MNKKIIIGLSFFALFSYFAYYMLTDDEISEDALSLLSKAVPTSNVDNNVFIHLAALHNGDYDSAKNKYLFATETSKLKLLEFSEQFSYPASLIEEDFFASKLHCSFGEDGCFEHTAQYKKELFELFEVEMQKVEQFIFLSNNYDFEPLDSISSRVLFEGYASFNYLLGLSVYKEISQGNLKAAEELLFQHLDLSRKLAENSLDMMSSILFIVSLEQLYEPFIVNLYNSGHEFNQSNVDSLYPIPMKEVSLQKTAIAEFKFLYTATTTYIKPEEQISEEFDYEAFTAFGYKPNATINKMAAFWIGTAVPEDTPKSEFLAKNSSKQSKRPDFKDKDPFEIILNNPRNFIGELLLAASLPRFLDAAEDYASGDLKLLLFKLLIKSQKHPLEELLDDPQYLDPYTGNKPYESKGKICYPGWHELADDDGNVEDTCIKLPVGR